MLFLRENYPNSISWKCSMGLFWSSVFLCYWILSRSCSWTSTIWTSLFQQCLYLWGSNEIMQQGASGLFSFVNIIGWELASVATVWNSKSPWLVLRDLVFASIFSSLSSQLYYNSVHCDIQNLFWVNITIGDDLALVDIPQGLLRLDLALQGAGQPDDQQLQIFHETFSRKTMGPWIDTWLTATPMATPTTG